MTWEASDIISAVLAGLTLIGIVVALIVGIKSILATHSIQKREFRYRLLNEIAEWAIKPVAWRSENREVFREMARIKPKPGEDRDGGRLVHAHIAEVQDFFSEIVGMDSSVVKLSLTFQQGLPEGIQELAKNLRDFMKFLDSWREKLFADMTGDKVETGLDENWPLDEMSAEKLTLQVEKSARVVLEKIAELKAKEIG